LRYIHTVHQDALAITLKNTSARQQPHRLSLPNLPLHCCQPPIPNYITEYHTFIYPGENIPWTFMRENMSLTQHVMFVELPCRSTTTTTTTTTTHHLIGAIPNPSTRMLRCTCISPTFLIFGCFQGEVVNAMIPRVSKVELSYSKAGIFCRFFSPHCLHSFFHMCAHAYMYLQ
jgi:hypothetical protein